MCLNRALLVNQMRWARSVRRKCLAGSSANCNHDMCGGESFAKDLNQYPLLIQVVCKGFNPPHLMIAIRGRTGQTFPSDRPSPPHLVHEQSSIQTHLTRAGPTLSSLAWILT